MPVVDHILFPVDFSERCAAAAPHVRAMAAMLGARVTLLHAIDVADYLASAGELGGFTGSDIYRQYKEDASRRLDGFLASELPGAARHLAEGEAGQRIVEFAEADGAGLIMMPTHGLGAFRRLLLGSVAAKVLHDASCPVWTGAHLEEEAPPAGGGVFCAVDLGPQSEATLRWAASYATKTGARLTLIHTVPGVESWPGRYLDAELHAELRRQARAELETLRTRVSSGAEILLVDGEPAPAIREAALARQPDLLVIARGSAAEGLGRLRKHAYDIIRQVPCPTVSV